MICGLTVEISCATVDFLVGTLTLIVVCDVLVVVRTSTAPEVIKRVINGAYQRL
jgi:hypothetical protein